MNYYVVRTLSIVSGRCRPIRWVKEARGKKTLRKELVQKDWAHGGVLDLKLQYLILPPSSPPALRPEYFSCGRQGRGSILKIFIFECRNRARVLLYNALLPARGP